MLCVERNARRRLRSQRRLKSGEKSSVPRARGVNLIKNENCTRQGLGSPGEAKRCGCESQQKTHAQRPGARYGASAATSSVFCPTQASLIAPVPSAIGPQSNRIDRHLSAKLSAIFDLTQVPSPPMGRVPAVRKKAVPERALVCHARISYLHTSPHALPAGRFRLW